MIPNSLIRLWRELKRRKVGHVITIYAAVSFVILQVIDIIVPPLQLPAWTLQFVIVLLCIGFVISVFVSWVYDITPSGVKRTKPASVVKNRDQNIPVASKGWKIATYICGATIIVLVVFNVISKRKPGADPSLIEKSIAVLPFTNDSPSDSNKYFINGIQEEILDNLQKVKDFRILSRTSTEQYMGLDRPTIPEIANKLGVSYIVEGSGEKYGSEVVIRVKLYLAGKEKSLWAKEYKTEIQSTSDPFGIQSEIAQAIAAELKTTISPDEKQLIEKMPTANLTAYDFYLRGWDEERAFHLHNSSNKQELEEAERMYKTALKYDSTYALCYTGLARIYYEKHYREGNYSKNFLDSVLILSNIALKYDDQLDEAYTRKGLYYSAKGNKKQANEEFDKALKINPNYWVAYFGKGMLYFNDDYIKTIDNLQKAVKHNQGTSLPYELQQLCQAYLDVGFIDKAKYFLLESLKIKADSANYFRYLGTIERDQGNYAKALPFFLQVHELDSTNVINLFEGMAKCYMLLGQNKESLKYYKTWLKIALPESSGFNGGDRIGYAYWVNGEREKAKYYFDKQMEYCNIIVNAGHQDATGNAVYYDLAAVYAFRGDKINAYKNLKIFDHNQVYSLGIVELIKIDPLFNGIRYEPEFQEIVKDVEAKYHAEHERVKKWLDEQGMLNRG